MSETELPDVKLDVADDDIHVAIAVQQEFDPGTHYESSFGVESVSSVLDTIRTERNARKDWV